MKYNITKFYKIGNYIINPQKIQHIEKLSTGGYIVDFGHRLDRDGSWSYFKNMKKLAFNDQDEIYMLEKMINDHIDTHN